jgi:type IV pilus assembly protein PilW
MNEHCHKEKYSFATLKIPDGVGGFSLIELLIAMAVGLIIIGATYSVFIIQNKQINNQDKIVEMQQNVRAAMDMMSREVRMAGYDPCGLNSDTDSSNNFDGVTWNSAQLQIKADLDGNNPASNNCQSPYKGIDMTSQENIIYEFDGTNKQITRNIGAGDQPFAENIIQNDNGIPLFSYLDKNGNATSTAKDIRKVRLTITGRTSSPIDGQSLTDWSTSPKPTYTLSADVYARNLAF